MNLDTKKIERKKSVLFLALFFVILCIVFVKVYMVMEKNVVISTEQLYENLTDFQINGKEVVSLSRDPNIYYELSNEKNLNCINIIINSMNVSKSQAQVFYKNYNEDFTEEKSVALILEKGDNFINIPDSYNQLRLDLTNEKGVSIQLDKVILMRSEERIVDCLLGIIFLGIMCFWSVQGIAIWAKKINLTKVNDKYKNAIKCGIVLLLICGITTILSDILIYARYHVHFWETSKSIIIVPGLYIIVFIFGTFLDIFGVGYKKVFNFLFNKRWWIAAIVLLYLVSNRLHGDSLAMYDAFIQPGMGSENVQPILGSPRGIRSDEWVVSAQNILSSQFSSFYNQYNDITRGIDTLKAPTGGIYLSYSTIGSKPFQFIWAVLDTEYAYSFYWYAPIILAFMVTIEFCLILTKKDKLMSLTGAFLIICSSYYMWWGFPSIILGAHASVTCIYHFFHSKKIKNKIGLGIGTAISASYFILILYPAWQVPVAYLVLAILIGIFHDSWDEIKNMSWKEYVIIGCSFLFMVSLVVSYLLEISEYMQAITNTVYPGQRFETGGGGLSKLFYYFQAPFYAYKDIGNSSEAGVFFSLFPIPMLMALYLWIKSKKKDWMTGGLLIVTSIFILYAIVPIPKILAKVTLLSNVTNIRLLDIIGLAQIYFIVLIFSRLNEGKKRIPILCGMVIGIIIAGVSGVVSTGKYQGYLPAICCAAIFVVITVLVCCLVSGNADRMKHYFSGICIMLSLFTTILIRPISVGLDAIYSKPVANKIESIVEADPDGKWLSLTGGFPESAYLVMCGAKTVNSVNIYPNMDLWSQLDSNGIYEDVYNRYAHIIVALTNQETSFELVQSDLMKLNLAYKDLEKTGTKYIFQKEPIVTEENMYVNFELLYNEGNAYIYKINYN